MQIGVSDLVLVDGRLLVVLVLVLLILSTAAFAGVGVGECGGFQTGRGPKIRRGRPLVGATVLVPGISDPAVVSIVIGRLLVPCLSGGCSEGW